MRKPEATSIARTTGFNRLALKKFFNLLKKVRAEKKIIGSRIYNCDETGLSTVHQPSKILGKNGRHQNCSLTRAEGGSNITLVCCAFIFPRQRMKAELMDIRIYKRCECIEHWTGVKLA